jgi:hypothetical protein
MVDDDPALRDRNIEFEVNNGAVIVKGGRPNRRREV